MTITYSRGRSVHDDKPAQRTARDFGDFIAQLDADRAPNKRTAGYICGPLNGAGRRCAEGALPRRWLALDLDYIEADRLADVLWWFAERFSGCGWPTHSSTPERPRYRVILELDREATRAECMRLGEVLRGDLAAEFGDAVKPDKSTERGEQPLFVPPTGPTLSRFEGQPLDVDATLAAAPKPERDREPPQPEQHGTEFGDALARIKAGDDLHGTLRGLIASWAASGMKPAPMRAAVVGLLELARPARGARVDEFRQRELDALIEGAIRKYAPKGPYFGHGAPEGGIRVLRGDEFLRTFRVPDPLIDGLVPRGQLYALTARTGDGKTAVSALAQLCIANGMRFAGRDVERGRVLVLAGENPDDYALRLLATCQALGLKPHEATRDVHVVAGSFALGPALPEVEARTAHIGELAAVFVDTSAAFFEGDDENANVAMRAHASRLRTLTGLPGHPAVIALCHPIKHATKDNLLPRGGGAFLAEIDGNLTAWRDDKLVTVHWAGKLRGPGFEPVTFELAPQTLGVADSKGRPVASVAALPATGDRAEALEAAALSDENRLLRAMLRTPGGSVAALSLAAGFVVGMGSPNKSRTHRLLGQLAAQGLAKKSRAGRWQLTPKGRSEADEAPAG